MILNMQNDNASFDTDVREQMGHDTVEAEIKSLKRKLRLVDKALRKWKTEAMEPMKKADCLYLSERLSIVPEAQYTVEVEKKLVK